MFIIFLLVLVVGAVWAGLRMMPRSLPHYPQRTPTLETIDLPDDLPAPVARYYRAAIGDKIPVIHSMVLTGKARLRINGLLLPGRMRFTHDAGKAYRHYIEVTFWGYPVMRVNERYVDGKGLMELPFGTVEGPKIDQGANLAVWGESIWLPSVFITDSRVRWEAVDEQHARLIVPFEDAEEVFDVTFDAATGYLTRMETMRYKGEEATEKTRWINEVQGWKSFHGVSIPSPATVTWADDGQPWSYWTIEDVVYNVDVRDYIRAKGP